MGVVWVVLFCTIGTQVLVRLWVGSAFFLFFFCVQVVFECYESGAWLVRGVAAGSSVVCACGVSVVVGVVLLAVV